MPSIFIYSDNLSQSLVTEEVADFLRGLGLRVELRGDFLHYLSLEPERILEFDSLFSKTRVLDVERPVEFLPGNQTRDQAGVSEKELYDGFWAQRIFSRFFLDRFPRALRENDFHAIITGRLLGTFGDRRYHARVVLSGFPSIVSTAGVVEGPARPREYYLLKADFTRSGRDVGELDELYRGKFIAYGDERMTKITGAYVLQPLLHHFAGKEFCRDRSCALFNSHWQKEVLDIQHKGDLCAECGGEIAKIAGMPES